MMVQTSDLQPGLKRFVLRLLSLLAIQITQSLFHFENLISTLEQSGVPAAKDQPLQLQSLNCNMIVGNS